MEPARPRVGRLRGRAAERARLDGLRHRVRRGHLEQRLGRRLLRRPHGRRRLARAARRRRAEADGGHGRELRWLHVQLHRRAHHTLPRARHAREHLPPRGDVRRERLRAVFRDRDGHDDLGGPRDLREALPASLREKLEDSDAGPPRRKGLPRAHQRGAHPLRRAPGARRRERVRRLPRRKPLDPEAAKRRGLVRPRAPVSWRAP